MPDDNVTIVSDSDDTEPAELLAPFDPIKTARRRHGAAGAIMAAGMFGLDQALSGRKVKQEAPIVVSASDQPIDIDLEGITLSVDEATSVIAPPLPRSDPFQTRRRRRGRA